MRRFLALSIAFAAFGFASRLAAAEKPNVVVILADDNNYFSSLALNSSSIL